jgi:hypothetical protein
MMGRLKREQGQFFYSFCLDEVIPDDHRVSEIADVLDLSWVHAELRHITRRWVVHRSIRC